MVGVRLVVDVGAACVRAVLCRADGSWEHLLFDGASSLPAGVLVSGDGSVLTGLEAATAAVGGPDGFVAGPVRLLAAGMLEAGAVKVEAVELVAALLRRVVAEAVRRVGHPPGEVCLVVPGGWGPQRRTLLRQAAHRAGVVDPQLVPAPVAVVQHLAAGGLEPAVGQWIVVCDLGAGLQVSVLRRLQSGYEVLAALPADCGGDRVDAALAARLSLPTAGGTGSPPVAVVVRVAKETAVSVGAVAVPGVGVGAAAVVVTDAVVAEVAGPVLDAAARVVVQSVEAAQVPAQTGVGVVVVGAGAVLPGVAQRLAAGTALPVRVLPQPQVAAVLGAARPGVVDTPAGGAGVDEGVGAQVSRLAGALLPGLGSLALITQALFTGQMSGGGPFPVLLFNWGELAVASVLAAVACVGLATQFAANLGEEPGDEWGPPVPAISTGLLVAAAAAVTLPGLYVVAGVASFTGSGGSFLRWALLPVLPVAGAAVFAALVAVRSPGGPRGGWQDWVLFPHASVVCATAGMLAVQYATSAVVQGQQAVPLPVVGRAGGLLIGVATGFVLARRVRFQLILAAPIGVFTAAVVGPTSTGVVAAMYCLAVGVWWARRAWALVRHLLRRPPRWPTTAAAPGGPSWA